MTLEQALSMAINDFGVEPTDEPARATSLVADLIADPHEPTAESIVALRSVLREIAVSDTEVGLDPTHLAELVGRGCTASERVIETTTSTVLAALEIPIAPSQDVSVDSIATVPPTPAVVAPATAVPDSVSSSTLLGGSDIQRGSNSPRLFAAAVVVVAALGIVGVIASGLLSSEPELATTDTTTSVAPTATVEDTPGTTEPAEVLGVVEVPDTEPEEVAPDPVGFTVTFPEVQEGAFLVERGWRVTPNQDELIGIIRLRSPNDLPASGLHQELAPAIVGDGVLVTWNPAPATTVNQVARYNTPPISSDQVFEIEFRAPIDPAEPLTEADVLNWFDEWSAQVEALSLLDNIEPLLEPEIVVVTE